MSARGFSLVALSACLASCSAPQSTLSGGGPAAKSLAALGWFSLLLFSGVTVVVWVLIAWAATRRRGTLKEHAPVDIGGGEKWVVYGGFVIPAIILTAVFVITLITMGGFPVAHAAEKDETTPEIRVIGHQWWFDAEYLSNSGEGCSTPASVTEANFRAPTEIHIPIGRPVHIELVSRDVIHSFWIPRLHGKVDLIPGQSNHVRIQADSPGTYEGECGEYCGAQHAHMRVRVIAQLPADYEAWRTAQHATASEPTGDQARRGKAVFEAAACPLCHTVRGTGAQGGIGPDLTHIASRGRIAGGSLDNDTATLTAWVTHAQSLKPGSQMPNLTQFDGPELHALVAYLQGLH